MDIELLIFSVFYRIGLVSTDLILVRLFSLLYELLRVSHLTVLIILVVK